MAEIGASRPDHVDLKDTSLVPMCRERINAQAAYNTEPAILSASNI